MASHMSNKILLWLVSILQISDRLIADNVEDKFKCLSKYANISATTKVIVQS
jgi:hypothetical protein